jgi:hypothetical protein
VFWWDWVASGGTVTPPPKCVFLPVIANSASSWTGSVILNDGWCCIAGRADVPLSITVAFSATSAAGPVTQMRISPLHVTTECSSASLAGANWEPFVTERVYTFTPPLNFVGIQLEVQYQDTQGTESPVYCDDITVEGMP